MLSKKTQYGLKAVFYLAKHYEAGPILITDLVKAEQMPQKFLEAILLELKKQGILQSKKGKGGGYALAKSPQDVTLGEIIRVLDGSFESMAGTDLKENSEIAIIMKEVQTAMSNILDKTTLADAIERCQVGQQVLNYMI